MTKKTHGRILVELSDIWIMEGRDDLFEDCLDEVCSESVSYTHLTLPTKA